MIRWRWVTPYIVAIVGALAVLTVSGGGMYLDYLVLR